MFAPKKKDKTTGSDSDSEGEWEEVASSDSEDEATLSSIRSRQPSEDLLNIKPPPPVSEQIKPQGPATVAGLLAEWRSTKKNDYVPKEGYGGQGHSKIRSRIKGEFDEDEGKYDDDELLFSPMTFSVSSLDLRAAPADSVIMPTTKEDLLAIRQRIERTQQLLEKKEASTIYHQQQNEARLAEIKAAEEQRAAAAAEAAAAEAATHPVADPKEGKREKEKEKEPSGSASTKKKKKSSQRTSNGKGRKSSYSASQQVGTKAGSKRGADKIAMNSSEPRAPFRRSNSESDIGSEQPLGVTEDSKTKRSTSSTAEKVTVKLEKQFGNSKNRVIRFIVTTKNIIDVDAQGHFSVPISIRIRNKAGSKLRIVKIALTQPAVKGSKQTKKRELLMRDISNIKDLQVLGSELLNVGHAETKFAEYIHSLPDNYYQHDMAPLRNKIVVEGTLPPPTSESPLASSATPTNQSERLLAADDEAKQQQGSIKARPQQIKARLLVALIVPHHTSIKAKLPVTLVLPALTSP